VSSLDLDPTDQETFGTQVVALIVMSIPEAENETLEWLNAMVRPAHLHPTPRTPNERADNEAKYAELADALANPELEDTITIVEAVIRNERDNLASLGKRLTTALSNPSPTTPETLSADRSPKPSTPSPKRTGGKTKISSN
jgi:hypothetical protein